MTLRRQQFFISYATSLNERSILNAYTVLTFKVLARREKSRTNVDQKTKLYTELLPLSHVSNELFRARNNLWVT